MVAENIHAGMSTEDINKLVHEYTIAHGGIPAPLNYCGFPKSVCTSVNDVICHGIPSPDEILQDGDIINVDVTTILDGYYADASRMFCIGQVETKPKLVEVTKESVDLALAEVKPWGHLGDIGEVISKHVYAHGYTVLHDIQAVRCSCFDFTKNLMYATSAKKAPACCWFPAWYSPSNPW